MVTEWLKVEASRKAQCVSQENKKILTILEDAYKLEIFMELLIIKMIFSRKNMFITTLRFFFFCRSLDRQVQLVMISGSRDLSTG